MGEEKGRSISIRRGERRGIPGLGKIALLNAKTAGTGVASK